MKRTAILFLIIGVLASGGQWIMAQEKIIKTHALAMHGNPKYGPDFKHYDYANPDAPKGGDVRLAAVGTFDKFNPFILKGSSPAAGLGLMYDTLLDASYDEPFTEYGLLVETIEVPENRSWVIFTLRKEARWHDGQPITADDVVFSLNILKSKGHPQYRFYYANVEKVLKLDTYKVKFVFSGGQNRELPLIIGQLPILPKHYWEKRDFEKASLEIPLGSGPYKIESFDPGRSITYVRVENYWAKDLPVRKGFYNFNRLRYDYYRDQTVTLEALKAGEYDLRIESSAKDWATAYDVPAVKDGLLKKDLIPHEGTSGMQAFVFNTRRPIFQDRRVREALVYAFDFEWSNKNLFYGQYKRTNNYFANSELASSGLPGPEELKLLEPFRGKIPEEVFTREYKAPVTEGSGQIRPQLAQALDLLGKAGWVLQNGKLVHAKSKAVFYFEILLGDPLFERIAMPFKKNLERLGIEVRVRVVDTAQYQKRIENFDFDMIEDIFPQSLSPGNEQRDFWGTTAATTPGSRNTIGVKDPAVDALVDKIIAASDRESLVFACRALDRVLLWNHYVVPHWHFPYTRVVYWDKFNRSKINPRYVFDYFTWWVDPSKEAQLKTGKGSMKSK